MITIFSSRNETTTLMKKLLTLLFILFLSFQTHVYGQLPDGSIAPNWTLSDINGNTYTLYSLLAQGKMVVIEFSATWCGPCWNYMQTGALETFWDEHGPNGDNSAQVFYIEADWSTGMADLLGLTPSSQGNWVANISFPIIDLAPGVNTASQYGINYYPTLYAVCHDHSLYELGQVPASVWSDFIESCNMEAAEGNVEPALCVGEGSATVDVSGGHLPYAYHWSNGGNTQTISGLNAGTYHVTVTEGNGKISKVDFVIPGATTPVSISGASVEPALCNGSTNGSIYIDVQGGTPGYQYDWSNGASSQDLQNVAADTYTITITDNNGCELIQSYTVNEPDPLEATADTTPDNCDQGDGTITLSIEGGAGNYIVTSSVGTVYGNQIIDLPAGLVSVGVSDGNGCAWSQNIVIGFQDAPSLDLVQGPDLSCTQLSTTVSGYPSGGFSDFSYQWTTADGHIVTNATLATITVDAAGTYQLQVTDNVSGCLTIESEQVQSNIAVPDVDAGQQMQIDCENLQVTLEGTGDPLNTINWSTSGGHIVSGGNSYHPITDAPGIYYIQVTNPTTNCSNQDSMLVSNGSNPASSAFQYVSSGLTINGTDISTGSNLSGWSWTFGDGGTSTVMNVVHTYSAAGTYEVCLSVQNGCGINQSCQMVEVTSSGSVILVDATVTNVLCFGQSTGSIFLSVNGGSGTYTYAWTGTDTTYTTSSLQDIPAGSYQLVLTDDQGNVFINGYTVEQPSALTLGGSTVIDNSCFGQSNGSITLDIFGGIAPYLYSFNGSAPQTENFLNQLPGGSIQATVTDSNGCVLLAGPYTIFEPSQIILDSTSVTDASGSGQSDGAIELQVSGGIAPYLVTWSNGATGTSITNLIPGTYTYIITDANGCTYSSPAPVIVNFATGIKEATWPEYITVTPNPTKGDAIIKWSELPSGNASISVMSVDGKVIASHMMSSPSGKWELSSIGLTEGLYIVLLKQDKHIYPFKLIVL